jgi:hypothetical protein
MSAAALHFEFESAGTVWREGIVGMDLMGRAPKNKKGKYFRSGVWAWRPVHALIAIANIRNDNRLVPRKLMPHLGSSKGHGLEDQKSCDRLADALEWLLDHPAAIRKHGLEVGKDDEGEFIGIPAESSPLLCDKDGHRYTNQDARKQKIALKELRSAYQTPIWHVRKFTVFLHNCGGFEVW